MEKARQTVLGLIKADPRVWDQLISLARRRADGFAVTQDEWKPVASCCGKYLKTIPNARFYSLYNQLSDADVFFADYEDDELFEGKLNFVWDVLYDQIIDLILDEEAKLNERNR